MAENVENVSEEKSKRIANTVLQALLDIAKEDKEIEEYPWTPHVWYAGETMNVRGINGEEYEVYVSYEQEVMAGRVKYKIDEDLLKSIAEYSLHISARAGGHRPRVKRAVVSYFYEPENTEKKVEIYLPGDLSNFQVEGIVATLLLFLQAVNRSIHY